MDMPAEDWTVPPAGQDDYHTQWHQTKELWYCRLCSKENTPGHVQSDKHKKNVAYYGRRRVFNGADDEFRSLPPSHDQEFPRQRPNLGAGVTNAGGSRGSHMGGGGGGNAGQTPVAQVGGTAGSLGGQPQVAQLQETLEEMRRQLHEVSTRIRDLEAFASLAITTLENMSHQSPMPANDPGAPVQPAPPGLAGGPRDGQDFTNSTPVVEGEIENPGAAPPPPPPPPRQHQ